jgi:Prokaryotic glutathione synthetase, ATP-grasp domain
MSKYDITLLTDARYVHPKPGDWYVENILLEDALLRAALEARGLSVYRTNWDDSDFDWRETRYALFRTTWDYFDRFPQFSKWLDATAALTQFINPLPLIRWNMDKHYLRDLAAQGILIPATQFIEPGESRSLTEIAQATGWDEYVLKPAISGAGRHTYRLSARNVQAHEDIFQKLIAQESMLLQAFQHNVVHKGELTLMMMNGQYTHAVLKKAKEGDFRVQDDFGGVAHDHTPTAAEIQFAEQVLRACPSMPLYARVDMIWDNEGRLCVSELEAIEPELWFRRCPSSVEPLADGLLQLVRG